MKEFDLGICGFLLGCGAFIAGCAVGTRRRKTPGIHAPTPDSGSNGFEEEQRAFRALTGYNADIAYGTAPFFPEADA